MKVVLGMETFAGILRKTLDSLQHDESLFSGDSSKLKNRKIGWRCVAQLHLVAGRS